MRARHREIGGAKHGGKVVEEKGVELVESLRNVAKIPAGGHLHVLVPAQGIDISKAPRIVIAVGNHIESERELHAVDGNDMQYIILLAHAEVVAVEAGFVKPGVQGAAEIVALLIDQPGGECVG